MKHRCALSLVVAVGMVGACSGDDDTSGGTGGAGTGTGTGTTTTTTTITGSTTTGTNTDCGSYQFSEEATCQDCLETACCSELAACDTGTDCAALVDCRATCTDSACFAGCDASHAGGVDAAQALYECLDDSCASNCADGICGTELVFTDNESLTQCATDHCCASFMPCYDDGDCNGCLQDPEGAGCDTNALYETYGTCMDGNCPTRICESTLAYPSWVMNLCVNDSCCESYDPCFEDGACNSCVQDPDGEGCDTNTLFGTYLTCKESSCPAKVCTTTIGYSVGDDPAIACNLCAGESCCEDLDTCDGDGTEAATTLCLACLADPTDAACDDTAVHDAAVAFNACLSSSCADDCL